jgi:hypothetical protein
MINSRGIYRFHGLAAAIGLLRRTAVRLCKFSICLLLSVKICVYLRLKIFLWARKTVSSNGWLLNPSPNPLLCGEHNKNFVIHHSLFDI